MKLRILLADDHKLFCDGLRSMLAGESSIEIIGESRDGQAAIKQVKELKPDIVLMDISMPNLNGIEATRKILVDHPATKVIILSMHSDKRFVVEALKAGAKGYLLKDSTFQEFLQAIRDCAAGKIYLSAKINDFVINDYIDIATTSKSSAFTVLSTREREVLQLLAEGKTTKESASTLNISVKTVESHRKQIMDKLHLHSIAELTKYAIREGLTQLS